MNNALNGHQTRQTDSPRLALIDLQTKEATDTPEPTDLITRLRDRWGNRLPWRYSFRIPTVGGERIDETAAGRLLDQAASAYPLRAESLRHFHDNKLLVARTSAIETAKAEAHKIEDLNQKSVEANATIESKIQEQETARDVTLKPWRKQAQDMDEIQIPAAHAEAAAKVSTAGGFYEPENPTAECVLRHKPRALEEVAAHLGLPWTPGDEHGHAPSWLGWLVSVAVGTLLGISLLIVTHVCPACRLADRPWMVAVAVLVGIGLASAAKFAVHGAWYHVGQRYLKGRQRAIPCSVVAVVRTAAVLFVDVAMERQGLLALMQLHDNTMALSGQAVTPSPIEDFSTWAVALVVTGAYLFCAADNGYFRGRYYEVLCALKRQQQVEFDCIDAARRAEPHVQEALNALARVNELVMRRAELECRIGEVAAPYQTKISELRSKLLPERNQLSSESLKLLQDRMDDFHGAQATFDGRLEQLLHACEPVGGFWKRLARAITGNRRVGSRVKEAASAIR